MTAVGDRRRGAALQLEVDPPDVVLTLGTCTIANRMHLKTAKPMPHLVSLRLDTEASSVIWKTMLRHKRTFYLPNDQVGANQLQEAKVAI